MAMSKTSYLFQGFCRRCLQAPWFKSPLRVCWGSLGLVSYWLIVSTNEGIQCLKISSLAGYLIYWCGWCRHPQDRACHQQNGEMWPVSTEKLGKQLRFAHWLLIRITTYYTFTLLYMIIPYYTRFCTTFFYGKAPAFFVIDTSILDDKKVQQAAPLARQGWTRWNPKRWRPMW